MITEAEIWNDHNSQEGAFIDVNGMVSITENIDTVYFNHADRTTLAGTPVRRQFNAYYRNLDVWRTFHTKHKQNV